MEPGDWLIAVVGVLYCGAAVAYALRRRWPEAVMYAAYGIASFALIALALARRGTP